MARARRTYLLGFLVERDVGLSELDARHDGCFQLVPSVAERLEFLRGGGRHVGLGARLGQLLGGCRQRVHFGPLQLLFTRQRTINQFDYDEGGPIFLSCVWSNVVPSVYDADVVIYVRSDFQRTR